MVSTNWKKNEYNSYFISGADIFASQIETTYRKTHSKSNLVLKFNSVIWHIELQANKMEIKCIMIKDHLVLGECNRLFNGVNETICIVYQKWKLFEKILEKCAEFIVKKKLFVENMLILYINYSQFEKCVKDGKLLSLSVSLFIFFFMPYR